MVDDFVVATRRVHRDHVHPGIARLDPPAVLAPEQYASTKPGGPWGSWK